MSCLLLACSELPPGGQTGRVAAVAVTDEGVAPQDVTVHPGDEVRIANHRSTPIWIYFNRDRRHELSCQRGFVYEWGVEESAKVAPGDSASLCFAGVGEYGYRVQFQETDRGGESLGQLNFRGFPGGIVVTE